MATTITIGAFEVDYSDFRIEIPLSPVGVAPKAVIRTTAVEDISAGDAVTIDIDGSTKFSGDTVSAGKKQRNGARRVECEHPAHALFADTVTVNETGPPTAEEVLNAALSASQLGGSYTLNYPGTATTLGDDYAVEDRRMLAIFRDMADRTSRVWRVDPVNLTIDFEPVGDRGLWQALDAEDDSIGIVSFDDGSVKTVRNAVTVNGTGAEKVQATETASFSISTYGRRTGDSPYNVQYITSQAEASNYAEELLVPQPLSEGEFIASSSVGDVTVSRANQTVDLTDAGKDIDSSGLVIEKQVIEQGRATFEVGEGSGVSLENVNRKSKSRGDLTEAGSVYGNDRLADDSVDTEQLVDTAVIEAKLADLSVALEKVQDGAIAETKVQDDAISTPKLQAEAVTAAKILADTITANEIATGTITALEIAADTLTANEIDTLDLDTNELTIGANADRQIEFSIANIGGLDIPIIEPSADGAGIIGQNATRWREIYVEQITADSFQSGPSTVTLGTFASEPWQFSTDGLGGVEAEPNSDDHGSVGTSVRSFDEMWAYDFFDADTNTSLSDGGDPLKGLAEGRGPPEFAQVEREHEREDGETETVSGTSISKLSRWLADICREQQAVIEDLEERLSALESAE